MTCLARWFVATRPSILSAIVGLMCRRLVGRIPLHVDDNHAWRTTPDSRAVTAMRGGMAWSRASACGEGLHCGDLSGRPVSGNISARRSIAQTKSPAEPGLMESDVATVARAIYFASLAIRCESRETLRLAAFL